LTGFAFYSYRAIESTRKPALQSRSTIASKEGSLGVWLRRADAPSSQGDAYVAIAGQDAKRALGEATKTAEAMAVILPCDAAKWVMGNHRP